MDNRCPEMRADCKLEFQALQTLTQTLLSSVKTFGEIVNGNGKPENGLVIGFDRLKQALVAHQDDLGETKEMLNKVMEKLEQVGDLKTALAIIQSLPDKVETHTGEIAKLTTKTEVLETKTEENTKSRRGLFATIIAALSFLGMIGMMLHQWFTSGAGD
jgi:ABC-type transporter Mla subunit MlaD